MLVARENINTLHKAVDQPYHLDSGRVGHSIDYSFQICREFFMANDLYSSSSIKVESRALCITICSIGPYKLQTSLTFDIHGFLNFRLDECCSI